MNSDDQAGEPDFHDDLARLAEELQATAELIHTFDGWWAADDGVDAVDSIVRSAAHALRALAGWYDRSRERIFDDHLGAEHDATIAVAAAERELRTFAAELEALADRHARLVIEVDHLHHRDLYAIADDELAEHPEHYAVREISQAPGTQLTLGTYEHEDVARAEACASARLGFIDRVYRVIAVSPAGESTVAQWPGQGDADDPDA